jgi:membrane-associated phospholipid phosphatase
MDHQTHLSGTVGLRHEIARAGGELRAETWSRYKAVPIIWIVGLLAFIVAAVIIHIHPGPFAVDLQTTITIQHSTPMWAAAFLSFVSVFNNPTYSLITVAVFFIVFALLRHFLIALCLAVGTLASDGINGLVSTIIGRPRPSSPLIHIYMPEPFHSFPSGHTEHDVVFYGFLLYLSLQKPVRQWRYRWMLLPLQLIAIIMLLSIGYSRVLEGSHWLTDALGGYLSGAILLGILIFLYRWAAMVIDHRHAKTWKDKVLLQKR